MCGFRAGKALSMEVSGEPGMKYYNRFWQDYFEFNDDKIFEECCQTFGMGNLTSDQFDYLYKLAEGKLLDGYINHFTCGKAMRDFFYSQQEKISKDRPDILETLKMSTTMSPEEAFNELRKKSST